MSLEEKFQGDEGCLQVLNNSGYTCRVAVTYDNLEARRHDLGDRQTHERPAVLRGQRAEAEGDAAGRREQD